MEGAPGLPGAAGLEHLLRIDLVVDVDFRAVEPQVGEQLKLFENGQVAVDHVELDRLADARRRGIGRREGL